MASMLVDWMNPGGNNLTRRFMPQISMPMVCDVPWRKRARSANRSGALLLAALGRTKLRHKVDELEVKEKKEDVDEQNYRSYQAPHGTYQANSCGKHSQAPCHKKWHVCNRRRSSRLSAGLRRDAADRSWCLG